MDAAATNPDVAVVRSGAARTFGAVLIGVGVATIGALALAGGVALLQFGGFAALLAVAGYVAYWRPHVLMAPHGLQVVNPTREVLLRWQEIDFVDGRYGLRLQAGDAHFDAWGVPAPTGMTRARGRGSGTAAAVTKRLEREKHRASPHDGSTPGAIAWSSRSHPRRLLLAAGVWAVLGPIAALVV